MVLRICASMLRFFHFPSVDCYPYFFPFKKIKSVLSKSRIYAFGNTLIWCLFDWYGRIIHRLKKFFKRKIKKIRCCERFILRISVPPWYKAFWQKKDSQTCIIWLSYGGGRCGTWTASSRAAYLSHPRLAIPERAGSHSLRRSSFSPKNSVFRGLRLRGRRFCAGKT